MKKQVFSPLFLLISIFLTAFIHIELIAAGSYGEWISPGSSADVVSVVEYKNGSRAKYVDFNDVNWSLVARAGLMLPRPANKTYSPLAGFESTYGSLLLYPLGYKRSPLHLFLKLHIKKGASWYEAFITKNNSAKTPIYSEQSIFYNNSGQILSGVRKELGYHTITGQLGYNFPVYVGLRGDQFSESFQLKTNITTPIDVDNVAIEYVFGLNPAAQNSAKKIKWIRTYRPNYNETTGELINYTIQDHQLNQFVDESKQLPDLVRTVAFVSEQGKEIQFFNFEDIWAAGLSTFWKIEEITLPNGNTTYVLRIGTTFGALLANETLEIDPDWISPTGFNDPGACWSNEANAYDDDTGTFAGTAYTPAGYTCFLELTISNITCDSVRHYSTTTYGADEIDVDFFDGSWHDVYEGSFPNNAWDVLSFGANYTDVSAARVRYSADSLFRARLYEFDFNNVTLPVDEEAPHYSNVAYNETITERSCQFSSYWTDNWNLSHAIFGWNSTGSWANDTAYSFGAGVNASWYNVTKTLPLAGTIVGFRFYANDTANNWNQTTIISFVVVLQVTYYYSGNGTFRRNCTTVTNGTSTTHSNNTVMDLAALPYNSSIVFNSFNYTSTGANGSFTTNPHNLTFTNYNYVVWCYFGEAAEAAEAARRGEYLAIGIVASLIFIPLLILFIWIVIRRKT